MSPADQQARRGLRPLLSVFVLRSQTDERLARLAAGRNGQAFAVLFERYAAELRNHAARIVRADRAEDVVQQAMLGAWTAMLGGTEVMEVRAWLHRIVHNAALSHTARRGYDDVEIPAAQASAGATEELAVTRMTATEALRAIAALPEAQRRALTLTAVEGLSGREAASALGLSENAARQLLHRARSGLRATASAITPLPLLNWAAGQSADGVSLGLGLTGVATAAKVVAVVGVTGATLGATHVLGSHPHAHTALHRGAPIQVAQGGPSASGSGARTVRAVTPIRPATVRLPRAGSHPRGSAHRVHRHGQRGASAGEGAQGQAQGGRTGVDDSGRQRDPGPPQGDSGRTSDPTPAGETAPSAATNGDSHLEGGLSQPVARDRARAEPDTSPAPTASTDGG